MEPNTTSEKDKFVELFKSKNAELHPNSFKENPGALAKIIRSDKELEKQWNKALEENK